MDFEEDVIESIMESYGLSHPEAWWVFHAAIEYLFDGEVPDPDDDRWDLFWDYLDDQNWE